MKGPNHTLEVRKVSSPELAAKEATYAVLKQEVETLEVDTLGVAHYINERTIFNAGVALSGNKFIYNARATLRFGKGHSDGKAYGPNASVAVLSEMLEKVQRESQQTISQKGQAIKDLQIENAQLRADVDMLKRMMLK